MEFVHNLSEEERALVGEIILNWGGVDYLLGQALVMDYGLQGNVSANGDLIYALDLRKKVQYLTKNVKKHGVTGHATTVLKLLAKACEDWAQDRNHLAHGVSYEGLDGEKGIFSPRRSPMIYSEDLPKLLARSKYLADLALRLHLTALPNPDIEQGPLPDRPE